MPQAFIDSLLRTIDSDSCVVVVGHKYDGGRAAWVHAASPERRLAEVVRRAKHLTVDWLLGKLATIARRWREASIDKEASALLTDISNTVDREIVLDMASALRDGLCSEINADNAENWIWLREHHAALVAPSHETEVRDALVAYMDSEIEHLTSLSSDQEIESGRETLLELAARFEVDVPAMGLQRLHETLSEMARAEDYCDEDEWRDRYRERAHEEQEEGRFIDGLFDSLADKS